MIVQKALLVGFTVQDKDSALQTLYLPLKIIHLVRA